MAETLQAQPWPWLAVGSKRKGDSGVFGFLPWFLPCRCHGSEARQGLGFIIPACSLSVLSYPSRMPESYRPIRHHPGKPPYTLLDASRENMLVVVTCRECRRCVHYLASDLVEVGLGSHPAIDPPTRCGKCKSSESMRVVLRQVQGGDLGKLIVRRPDPPKLVTHWRDVLL